MIAATIAHPAIQDGYADPPLPLTEAFCLDREAVRESLSRLTPSFFDGHTEFPHLDVEQRLIWSSQIVLFVSEFCGAALR